MEPEAAQNMKPTKGSSSRSQDGRLAECDNCGMKGTDLKICVQCKQALGPDVKLIQNPFTPRPPVKEEFIVKPEVLDDDSHNSLFSETVESPDGPSDQLDVEPLVENNIHPDRPTDVMVYEKRLRVIQANESMKPMILKVKGHSGSNKVSFHGTINIEDTMIEEIRKSDVPHTIRIIQMTPFGAERILNDEVYGAKLQKLIFGSPCSLDFILKMLRHAAQLKAVRFGAHALNLRGDDKKYGIRSQKLALQNLTSLEMAFDHARYDAYDPESKRLMRSKIRAILEVASTACPNLAKCEITIPDAMEPDLDSFLANRTDIKSRGTQSQNFKDRTVGFKVQKPKEPEQGPTPIVQSNTAENPSVASPEVEVIEVSEAGLMTCPENPKVPETRTVKSASAVGRRSSASDLSSFDGVDWDGDDQAPIPNHTSKLALLKVRDVKTKFVPASSVPSTASSTGSCVSAHCVPHHEARSSEKASDSSMSRSKSSGVSGESSKWVYDGGWIEPKSPKRARPTISGTNSASRTQDSEKDYIELD